MSLPLSAMNPASKVATPVWFLAKYNTGSSTSTLEVLTVTVVPSTVKFPPMVTSFVNCFTPAIFWSPVLNTACPLKVLISVCRVVPLVARFVVRVESAEST